MKIELSVIRIILSNEFPWSHKYHDLFITLFILFLDFPVFQLFFLIPFLLPFVVMDNEFHGLPTNVESKWHNKAHWKKIAKIK